MKTYIFDTFNRYKKFSEELDARTVLCNKSWYVLNDSSDKEVYIFNTDGTLIISISGRVTNATWKYIPANKSIIVSGNNQSYMVHPAFYDNTILALQIDGANEYAFLINEQNISSTNLRTFNDLVIYFAEKERQATLVEERKRQAAIEEQSQREIRAEQKKQQRIEDSEDGIRLLDVVIFGTKCYVMYWAWNMVPKFCLIFCENVLGKSTEWAHFVPICLFIEAILAIILFKLWRTGRRLYLIELIIVFIALLGANYCC